MIYPSQKPQCDSELAAALDRSAAWLAGLRRELRRKAPIVAGPVYDAQDRRIDRSTSQDAAYLE